MEDSDSTLTSGIPSLKAEQTSNGGEANAAAPYSDFAIVEDTAGFRNRAAELFPQPGLLPDRDPYYNALNTYFERQYRIILIDLSELKSDIKAIDIRKMEDSEIDEEDKADLIESIRESTVLFETGAKLLSNIGSLNLDVEPEKHVEPEKPIDSGNDQSSDWNSGMMTGELRLSLIRNDVVHKLDEIVTSQRKVLSMISDITFFTLNALRGRIELLKKLLERDSDNWDMLLEHDRCRRCFLKSAYAIEAAICKEYGLPNEEFELEVELGIRVRKLFVQLLNLAGLFEEIEEGQDESYYRQKLVTVAKSIGTLRSFNYYQDLRTQDRKIIADSLNRIIKWLSNTDDDNETTSKQLLSAIKTAFEMFFDINHRSELIDSDRIILADLCVQFELDGVDWDRIPPDCIEKMQMLLGRDRELDRIILDPDVTTPKVAFGVIETINTRLSQGRDSFA